MMKKKVAVIYLQFRDLLYPRPKLEGGYTGFTLKSNQIKSNQIKKSFIASCLHNFWAKIHNIPKEIEHLKYYTVL